MNTSISYIPNSDSDRTVWLNNFSTKINTYATLVGLTPAEVTAVQKDAAMYVYVINMLEVYKQTVNNITYQKCGYSASAFAKAVAPAKDNYFRFANVYLIFSFVISSSVENGFKNPHFW